MAPRAPDPTRAPTRACPHARSASRPCAWWRPSRCRRARPPRPLPLRPDLPSSGALDGRARPRPGSRTTVRLTSCLPSLSLRWSEDLTNPWCLSVDVVIEDGLTDLKVGKPLHGLRIELDPEPRRTGDRDQSVGHLKRLDEDVKLLQRVVGVAREGEIGRGASNVDVP